MLTNRNSTSLINALVSDNSNDQFNSLKHQASKFFTATLGLSIRNINDIETPILEHGTDKSAKEELDELLEPLDAECSAKVKHLLNKASNELLTIALSFQIFFFSQCDAINGSATEPTKKKSKKAKSSDKKVFMLLKDMSYPS